MGKRVNVAAELGLSKVAAFYPTTARLPPVQPLKPRVKSGRIAEATIYINKYIYVYMYMLACLSVPHNKTLHKEIRGNRNDNKIS